MPTLTILGSDGQVTISALAADTDFQVREGSCFVSTAAFAPGNTGFLRVASGATGDSFQIGSGKTVYLRADSRAIIHYEALA